MKKIMLLMLVAIAFNAQAQMRIQFDMGLGAALSLEDFKAGGISANVEPKFFINNNISAGLRLEGDVLFGGSISTDGSEVSVGLSSRAAQCLKGEYYVTDLFARPYVGFGLGRFTQANLGANSSGEATISASSSFGVAPEVGLALGSFRLSAIYNVGTGSNLVEISVGDFEEISRNYLVLQMSWKLFRIGL
jgi:outer membrane protein W